MAEYDPTDIQAQQRARDRIVERERLSQEQEAADVRWLLKHRQGRRIAWRLLERAGVYRLSFNTNAMSMAFAEGNRNFGLALLTQIHRLCPEQYPVMLAENAPKDAPTTESTHDD